MCLRRICLAAVLVVTAVEPTFALTCSGRGNGYLHDNVGRFPGTMLVLGRITVEEEVDDVPDELDEDPGPLRAQRTVPGTFEGHAQSGASFDLPLVTPIDVTVVCLLRICGQTPDDHERIYLLDRDLETGTLTFETAICPGVTSWPAPR